MATPLFSSLIMEEVHRENLDLKLSTTFVMLDAKSAFDVVRHSNLIRKLYHMGIPEQTILMIDCLYKNARSCVKWNGLFSDTFDIKQGVRQGGTLSADLYKIYVNQLLDELCDAQVGGTIGNINCCAPACADDITLTASNPDDLQVLINIAVDYSHREGYNLQPTKSVVLPLQSTTNKTIKPDKIYTMDGNDMPIVEKTTHIGITRSSKNSTMTTVEENIKKARRTLYSLMSTGMHGENGLDPSTTIALFRVYVLPVLTYGLEVVIPKYKAFEVLDKFHRKTIKQIMSLQTTVADPAVYMISGLLPMEAEIHIKILTLFGNICRLDRSSIEWQIAERQLTIKSFKSNSWFIDLKKICAKYEISNIQQYLYNPLTKLKWKSTITSKIKKFWINKIIDNKNMYSSLRYLSDTYVLGMVHPVAFLSSANPSDINRIPTKIRITTGTYILQSNRAAFNQNEVNKTCLLCNKADETLEHFLLICEQLEYKRAPILKDLIDKSANVLAKSKIRSIDLLQLIMDPFYYLDKSKKEESYTDIMMQIEPQCRRLCYHLHQIRYELLDRRQKVKCKMTL